MTADIWLVMNGYHFPENKPVETRVAPGYLWKQTSFGSTLCHITDVMRDYAAHVLYEDEHLQSKAREYASHVSPAGCKCRHDGCEWCQAKHDWLINDHDWRVEAWPEGFPQ